MNDMSVDDLKDKILITGAGGFVGFYLMKKLKRFNPIGITYNPSRQFENFYSVNLIEKNNVEEVLQTFKPKVVFHLAALTNPAVNEKNRELAKASNIDMTRNLIEALPPDTKLIFHSTDKIWSGNDSYPDEHSEPDPNTYHGELKINGEKLIREGIERHHILRLSVIHSYTYQAPISELAGPGQMIEKSLDKLAEGGKAEFFSNINRCFTKREELLSLHEMILSNENYGTYNVGSKMTSYYDRVKNLCSELSISSDNLSSTIGEVNPIEQNMNMEKFEATFSIKFT